MKFRAVKGMNDILPQEVQRWQHLESTFRRTVESYGYKEVRTPVLEPTALFVRSIGETTDVVEKEMYSFQHHKEALTLRPEGTASAARAYVQHSVSGLEPVTAWYYLGPMFRAERPQRGRYRQFYQAGCELFGDAGPACDAEMIEMLRQLFTALGVSDLTVKVNTLGGPGTRERYRERLVEYLEPHAAELSELSQSRLQRNPLRILDSKDPRDRELTAGAPSILDVLEAEDRAHWESFCACLDALGTPYEVDPGLVRGLDYYTRTVFEVCSNSGELGAQNTLAAGGRYDEMVRSLGGPSVPALGFAMGLERLLLALPERTEPTPPFCALLPLGQAPTLKALILSRELRNAGLRVDLDGRDNSLKSKLRRANSSGARWCLILGESELERGVVQLKDLAEHTQEELPSSQVVNHLARHAEATT